MKKHIHVWNKRTASISSSRLLRPQGSQKSAKTTEEEQDKLKRFARNFSEQIKNACKD